MYFRKLTIIIMVFGLIPVLMKGQTEHHVVPEDEEDVYFLLMGQADDAIKSENYEDAAKRLIEAMSVRPGAPTNVLLLSNLGMVYNMLGEDSLALASFNRAHEMAPSMVTVLENRGRLYLKLSRDMDAYNDFGKVIELDSMNHSARYYHGMMALYGGDASTASRDFNFLQKYYPSLYETQVAMANYHSLLRNDSEAIPYYKKLIEDDPSPEYYSSLAGCYLALGNLSDASETLAKGLDLYPEDAELYYYRAWLNRDRYLFNDAREDAKRSIQYGADPNKVNALLGN